MWFDEKAYSLVIPNQVGDSKVCGGKAQRV